VNDDTAAICAANIHDCAACPLGEDSPECLALDGDDE
jgi:hypothetical protein